MVQLAVKYDTRARDSYIKVVGQNNLYTLLEAHSLPIQMRIVMKARPDMQIRQLIIQKAAEALEAGRNNMPGITYDQFIYIAEQVYAGTALGELRLTLKKWIWKDKIEKQKQQERMIQIQNEGQKKMIQMQNQAAEKLEAIKLQSLKVDKELQTKSDIMIANNKY